MKQAVAIMTHGLPERDLIFYECYNSVRWCNYHPILAVVNGQPIPDYPWPSTVRPIYVGYNGHEVGAIAAAFAQTDYDEIFFLHDTCVVKNTGLFEEAFVNHHGRSVALSHGFLMLMGKFRREVIQKCPPPVVHSKMEAVVNGELHWTRDYIAAEAAGTVILHPPLVDNEAREEKWGRVNMVLENHWVKKWKGTWDLSMIKD